MGRAWRIEYEGALYHILSRGNEQGDIFYDNTDRGRFLDIIGELSERFAVDIHNSRFDTFFHTQGVALSNLYRFRISTTCRAVAVFFKFSIVLV
jgi:hypothetical protein